MLIRLAFYISLSSFLLLSCDDRKATNGKLNILCTTGIVEDLVKNIAGNNANVDALMGAGVDPHIYKASQGDIQKFIHVLKIQ